MEPTSQQRALDVLEASLDLPEAERRQLLADAGRADPNVGAELTRLEHARTRAPGLIPTDAGLRGDPSPDPAPERIGVYRLTRLIGHGGMGAVHEGIRVDGLFDQRVAIKLLAGRRWSQELEQRFIAERRILARLEHRNIARLYDGGMTADGQSFIVMEYIDGRPITEFAQANDLDLRARLGLANQLCGALQFAHQQLVVHADVKPSNVLVAPDGSVKLLDFGIAQLLGSEAEIAPAGRSANREPFTAGYAAPERRAGGAATVAGDVFSLGIVLRELLSPAAGLSQRPAELTAVIDKAIAADPTARYASVAALADDLVRWTRRMPLQAIPPTFRYRTGLFLARHRLAVAIGSVAVSGLIAATVVSTRLYLQAERARAAETRGFEELRELSSYLVTGLSDQMLERPGMTAAHRGTLDDARQRLERLAAARPDDARLQIELGVDILRIAENTLFAASASRSDTARVRANLAAASERLAHVETTAAELPGYWEVRAEIAAQQSGVLVQIDGDAIQAERYARHAISLAAQAVRRQPRSAATLTAALLAKAALALSLNGAGRQQESIAVLDAAAQTLRQLDAPMIADSPRLQRIGATVDFHRCDVRRWRNADADAFAVCNAIEQHLRQIIKARGPLISYESDLAYTLFLVATMLPQPGESPRALGMLNEARDILSRVLYFGENDMLSSRLLVIDAARASVLGSLGRYAEARDVAAQLLSQRRARFAALPNDHSRRREVATALRRVGDVEQQAGRADAACVAYREAGALWDEMEKDGTLLGFDLAPLSGQVPWIRKQLGSCAKGPTLPR